MSGDELRACPSCGRGAAVGFKACPWCAAPLSSYAPLSSGIGRGTQIDFGWAVAVVDDLLGEGGMGAVFHAWVHPRGAGGVQPPFEAAIKILHPTFAQQGHARELFANEARVLATLAHPSVVRFYGLADVRGTSAIGMEFVRGETLGALIERKAIEASQRRAQTPHVRALPSLTFDRAWHYFQQVLGALAATHILGIVHRDVKPDNVLLRTDGVAKLTDFGIARLPSQAAAATNGNMIAGTVAYMSPEQVEGKPLDGRSDLYSAGVMLFEALTGRLPFSIDDRSDWLVALDHVQTPAPPLRRFLPQAPLELELLIARALAKPPDDRFQSAIDFGNAFRATLGIADDAGWRAQQAMVAQASRYAHAISGGAWLHEPAELQQARQAVATAYRVW